MSAMLFNVCNYGFHFVVSRGIPTPNYGDLYALITALSAFAVITTTISTALVRHTAELAARNDFGAIRSLHRRVLQWCSIAGGTAFIGGLAASPWIISFLKLDHPRQLPPFALLLGLTLIVPPLRAMIQGLQQFGEFAVSLSVEGLGKFVFGALAVYLGFRGFGALYGIAIAMCFALIYTELTLYRRLRAVAPQPEMLNLARLFSTASGAFAATLATTALLSVDTILAKHYLTPYDAGLYSAVALAGKLIMFAVGFAPTLLLPKLTEASTNGQSSRRLLLGAAAATIACSGGLLAIYGLAPGLVLHVLVGSKYESASSFVFMYAIAMTALTLTSLVLTSRIAQHRFGFVGPLLFVAGAEAVAIVLHHGSIRDIVSVVLVAQIVALGASLLPERAPARLAQSRALETAA